MTCCSFSSNNDSGTTMTANSASHTRKLLAHSSGLAETSHTSPLFNMGSGMLAENEAANTDEKAHRAPPLNKMQHVAILPT